MNQIIKSVFVLFSMLLLVSCSKSSDNSSSGNKPQSNGVKSKARILEFGDVGLRLNLNRGANHKRRNGGAPCECRRCFGICAGSVSDNPDEGDPAQYRNSILHDNGNGTALLYILTQPDDDIEVDPTLFVDDDVTMPYLSGNIVIKAGQYAYSGIAGYINFKGSNYPYFGTVTVNFE